MKPLSRHERSALHRLIRNAQAVLAVADGESVESVARRMGCSRMTVWRLCRERDWIVRKRPCHLTAEARRKGNRASVASIQQRADEACRELFPLLTRLRAQGLSLQAIADRLNASGYPTRRGKPWNKVQVLMVLRRGAKLAGDRLTPEAPSGR
jgi:DNA-binding CsgD family transcriptional regulator